MRFAVPLVPLTVLIRVERRPFSPLKLSLLGLVGVTAIIGIALGLYVSMYYTPARKARQRRAEAVIDTQMELFGKAAEAQRGVADEVRARLVRLATSARRERDEATHGPAAERLGHQEFAALWEKELEAAHASLYRAEASSRRAEALERHIARLSGIRSRDGWSLEKRERLAAEVVAWPSTAEWRDLGIAAHLEAIQARQRAERKQAAIAAINDSEP